MSEVISQGVVDAINNALPANQVFMLGDLIQEIQQGWQRAHTFGSLFS